MNTSNKQSPRRFVLLPVLVLGLLFLFTSSAGAANNQIQVTVGGAATDVCPNIPGTQASLPSGMEVDESGDCYTPEPPPVDLCSNLSGDQSTLPSGYYQDGSGNCYVQPPPPDGPVDVCSNLEGIQASVPEGYDALPNGSCEEPTPDVDKCPNILGPQMVVPEGMVLENNVCFTPDTTTPTNNTPAPSAYEEVKNVPDIFKPVIAPLVQLIPEETKQWLRALPESVATAVPFYVFIIVAIVAIIPILQSIREALFVRQLFLLLKRERDVAEQKDNFVALASHYLRTPLTLMKSGLDTVLALKEQSEETVRPLQLQLNALDANIAGVLSEVDNNDALRSINAPLLNEKVRPVWRSGWFWGPIVASIIITAIANFLLVIVGQKQVSTSATFFHFLVAAVAFFILYLGTRNLYLQRKIRKENQTLIDHEQTIDKARNEFIAKTTVTLREGLVPINQTRGVIANTPSGRFFNEGYERIESILEKFLLLGHVQTGTERTIESFDLHEAIEQLLVTFNAQIAEKRIAVTNTIAPGTIVQQNKLLFNFVLSSLLDNAIKFNQENGTIRIAAEPRKKSLTIAVHDNGIGIENEKLDQLFKPFSRATSSIEFNYEGLGFSLFLDKLIMDYTGGQIQASSASDHGTELTVTTPVVQSA